MKLCWYQRSGVSETKLQLQLQSYRRRRPQSVEAESSELQHDARSSLLRTRHRLQTELNVAVLAAIFSATIYSATPDGNPVRQWSVGGCYATVTRNYRLQRQANSAVARRRYCSDASTTTLWNTRFIFADLLTWLGSNINHRSVRSLAMQFV